MLYAYIIYICINILKCIYKEKDREISRKIYLKNSWEQVSKNFITILAFTLTLGYLYKNPMFL